MALLAALVLVASGVRPADAQEAPIKNLRIPLEHYEDGRVKTQITASTARIAANGNINAEGVKVELYGPDGQVSGVVDADACFVDRTTGKVTSAAPVRFTQKGVSIAGLGFEWNTESRTVTILEQARVVFDRDMSRTAIRKN